MLEELGNILWIIYVIILILISVYFFLLFAYPDFDFNNYFQPREDTQDNQEDEESLFPERKEQIKFKRYSQSKLKIMSADREDEEENNESVGFEELNTLTKDNNFLRNYLTALEVSYDYKEVLYKKKLKEVNSDLGSYSKGLVNDHNTNRERLTIYKKELESIISTVDKRKAELNIQTIKKDFNLMLNSKNGFASLIGRSEMKDLLASQIFAFCRNPKMFFKDFQNIELTGSSGVGKTKMAETIAYIYCKSGILLRKKFRYTTKQEFTSQYVNESAKLTREILLSTLEGVLLIDEAYDLVPEKSFGIPIRDHGEEALAEIVNFLDKFVGLSVVILAGYKDKMKHVFEANEGLDRRFPHKYELRNYTSQELTGILITFIEDKDEEIKFDNPAANYLYTLVDHIYNKLPEIFSKQAGEMLNLSTYILKAIYNSKSYSWSDDLKGNISLIKKGINNYLKFKWNIHLG